MERQNAVTYKYFSYKMYGFLIWEADGQSREIFFKRSDLACDWKGSRAWAWQSPSGTPVTFVLVRESSKIRAEDIRPVFEGESGDLGTYWEVGQLIRTFDEDHNFAFAVRPDGDQIYVGLKSIKDEFENRISECTRVGDYIAYQVEVHRKNENFYRAANTELFTREENERLRAGLPLEEPTKPEPASVCAVENRKKSLKQLIEEKHRVNL